MVVARTEQVTWPQMCSTLQLQARSQQRQLNSCTGRKTAQQEHPPSRPPQHQHQHLHHKQPSNGKQRCLLLLRLRLLYHKHNQPPSQDQPLQLLSQRLPRQQRRPPPPPPQSSRHPCQRLRRSCCNRSVLLPRMEEEGEATQPERSWSCR